ncbi:SDR family oxidoreductase [Solimonas sp. K1W22B-7]|uniref:SDR family NAD(P)-dependent oxidoreductase n=1 Tax=Solimonas sp. K1W22B-7 TaxID=2303331 RepID=UPI000E334EEF|nr:SDR family oxidoreductase [Solimonas sp. K1W22B-7]AXQ28272.1 SDR family oxidoreductase [Solimonas sp. K1W22B-7]
MSKETVLITGASAGIGLALAEEFAANGHPLVLVARSAGKLKEIAADLRERRGVACEWIAADLSQPQAPQQLYDETVRRGLSVGILVNNAGVLWEGEFDSIALENHLGLVQVNIAAPTALAHLFLKPMLERRAGRILNIASTSAFNPVPSLATYAASKAYLMSWSEALALETRGRGVTVTAVCPGFTETAMIAPEGRKPMTLPLVPNLTPQQVARESYEACMAGRALRVNGLMNRLAIEGLRHQPFWLRRELVGLMEKWGI